MNPTNFEIDANLKKAVKAAAVEHDMTSTDILRDVIRKAEADPNTLVDAVSLALKSPDPVLSKKATTSSLMEPRDLATLDKFARKLATSRNNVINLLLRAFLAGVVK